MRRIIKWLFILLLLALLALAGLVVSKDAIARLAAEERIRAATGMDVKIEKLSVGILSPVVTVQNLKLYNTPEFGGTPFMDVRELHVEFDREAFAQRKLRIKLLRLDLAELTMVKNDAGSTNFQFLNFKSSASTTNNLGDIEFAGVDVANVSVGRVRLVDLKNQKRNREWNASLRDQVFKDIKKPGDAYAVLVLLWMRSGAGW
jgi:uncharacterized protein involved in outer membrane biogenesis